MPLLLFVVMLDRQLEVPEEGTLSMVFDCITTTDTHTWTHRHDDTNRGEHGETDRKREEKKS